MALSDRAIDGNRRARFWLMASLFICRRVVLRGILVFALVFGALLWSNVDRASFGLALTSWRSEFAVARGLPEKRETVMDAAGKLHRMTARDVVANPQIRANAVHVRQQLERNALYALVPVFLVGAITIWLTLAEIRR